MQMWANVSQTSTTTGSFQKTVTAVTVSAVEVNTTTTALVGEERDGSSGD
jgi:hypothetical protein